MSVPRGSAALQRLHQLLDHAQPDQPYRETEPLPAGLSSAPPSPWLWGPTRTDEDGEDDIRPGEGVPLRRALRDPYAYALPGPAGSDQSGLLHQPPDVALAGTGPLTPAQADYARTSLDVTMKGGTTSGVIYPLVLCELARRFRLRNVGGASAGAIAASLAAAAELGRTRWDEAGRPEPPPLDERARQQGRLRAGFVGLADATAWFGQLDDPGPPQYRLAQLFRPTAAARELFRVMVAGMRARWVPLGLLLLWSFDLKSRSANALVLVLAPVVAVADTPATRTYGWLACWLFAAVVLLCGSVGLVAVVAFVFRFGRWRESVRDHRDRRPVEPVHAPAARARRSGWPAGVIAAVLLVVLGLLSRTGIWAQIGGWRLLGAGLFGVVGVLVVVSTTLSGIARHAERHKFGLVSGAVPAPGATGRIADRVAGLAPAGVEHALVPWLSTALSDLAGLPRPSVLRFGHLWLAGDYRPPDPEQPRTAEQLARLREAANRSRRRVVNLELITTEIVHGVPDRFPLRDDGQQLFLRRTDLEAEGAQVFSPEVVDALCPPSNRVRDPPLDVATGRPVPDLFVLPEPGDLPVVFATRLSLALPGLFQAVRAYRLVGDEPVRDDYGARIRRGNIDLDYPATEHVWVEELWFSDGGITSNFPIHLFDTPLPLWPTVGIDLAPHPPGAAHQDVYLPSPSHPGRAPTRPQRGSLLSFAGSVCRTALSWSDTGQTMMPAFRGRVAAVRQGAEEGGSNLFMSSATIASLALRGALAGRRLAKRYGSDAHWRVHQWLRLRVALDSLAALHGRVGRDGATPPFSTLDAQATIDAVKQALQDTGGDPNPAYAGQPDPPLRWYDENLTPAFFAAVDALLSSYTSSPATAPDDLEPLRQGVPQPAPELRQVPPT